MRIIRRSVLETNNIATTHDDFAIKVLCHHANSVTVSQLRPSTRTAYLKPEFRPADDVAVVLEHSSQIAFVALGLLTTQVDFILTMRANLVPQLRYSRVTDSSFSSCAMSPGWSLSKIEQTLAKRTSVTLIGIT